MKAQAELARNSTRQGGASSDIPQEDKLTQDSGRSHE
jgi:hypothetical protein